MCEEGGTHLVLRHEEKGKEESWEAKMEAMTKSLEQWGCEIQQLFQAYVTKFEQTSLRREAWDSKVAIDCKPSKELGDA